ncbi:recombinase family protein [[Clostridium] fimetarium]|uniref:Site-specific DNA recombinase n=1 Tax=[Clostridium] fimetarium TaxID=99656 RepID=A0A1I0RD19_9FIRM|nr:recombinase family protein [[Clostridium] fimetarium]SEW38687.1 Site-specific DNA recombinase [[Clostridium] fimetarium]
MITITKENLYIADIKVAVYGRVSTDKEEQQISFAYQADDLKKIVDEHDNWKFYKGYFDEGVTGTLAIKRDAFQTMIADAKKDKFDMIVMRDVSRFARYTKEFLEYLEEIHKNGVVVYFTSYHFLSNDPMAKMTLPILAVVAEQESENKSIYTNKAHKQRQEKQFPFGSDNHFGYDLIKTEKGYPNKYRRNEEEAKIVEEIYDMSLNKDLGCRLIAKELMRLGYRTKTGNLNWYTSTVYGLLINKSFCGYLAYNKSHKDGIHSERCKNKNKNEHLYVKSENMDTIIDEDTFNKVQQKLHSKAKISSHPQLDKNGNPLKDKNGNKIMKSLGYKPIIDVYAKKLQCQCGSSFKKNYIRRPDAKGNRAIGYTCNNYDSSLVRLTDDGEIKEKCNLTTFDKVKLDMSALKIFDIIWIDRRKSVQLAYNMIIDCYRTEMTKKVHKNPENLEKDIINLNIKKENTLDMFFSGKLTDENFQNILVRIDKKIMALKEELTNIQDDFEELSSFDEKDEKKKIIDFLNMTIEASINVYGYKEIDQGFVDSFVSKIVAYEDGSFDWYINLKGQCNKQSEYKNKFAKNYKNRYLIDDEAIPIADFTINYEDACKFVNTYGRKSFQKPAWKDIKVKILATY